MIKHLNECTMINNMDKATHILWKNLDNYFQLKFLAKTNPEVPDLVQIKTRVLIHHSFFSSHKNQTKITSIEYHLLSAFGSNFTDQFIVVTLK